MTVETKDKDEHGPTNARIPTTWVDTTAFAQEEQFARWAVHGRASHYAPVNARSFFAKGAFWNLGPVVVTSAEVDPFISVRDRSKIAENPLDHVQVVALLAGALRFDSGEHIDDCCAKCVFICDYAKPYRLETGRTRIASAYIARTFLEDATGPVSAHGLIAPTAEAGFLAATLATLCNVLPFAAATSASFYARMLRDLTAAALFDPETALVTRDDLEARRRIERLVIAAAPGRLDARALCRSAGVGRSTLYRLFQRDGGLVTWDRKRRLHALFREVANPAESRSLSEIGAAHGFFDGAGLARTFKAEFGVPASDVRQRARAGGAWDVETDTGFERLRRSVGALSTAR